MSLPVYIRILASSAYIWAGFNTLNGFHLLCNLVGYFFFLHTYLGCGIALLGYVKPVSFLSFFLFTFSLLSHTVQWGKKLPRPPYVCLCGRLCMRVHGSVGETLNASYFKQQTQFLFQGDDTIFLFVCFSTTLMFKT